MDGDVSVPAKRPCFDMPGISETEYSFRRNERILNGDSWIKCNELKQDILNGVGPRQTDTEATNCSLDIENRLQANSGSRETGMVHGGSSPDADKNLPTQEANEPISELGVTGGKLTLWQFLLELLLSNKYPEFIRWTNKRGEFILLQAEGVAKLWGLRKDRNHRMNYDKLSRALRYYYEKNIIRKVHGHKFVYQFIGLRNLIKFCQQNCHEMVLPHRDWEFSLEDHQPVTLKDDRTNTELTMSQSVEKNGTGSVDIFSVDEERQENLVAGNPKQTNLPEIVTGNTRFSKVVDVDAGSISGESSSSESIKHPKYDPDDNHEQRMPQETLSVEYSASRCLNEGAQPNLGQQLTTSPLLNRIPSYEQLSQEQFSRFSNFLSTLSSLIPSLQPPESSAESSTSATAPCNGSLSSPIATHSRINNLGSFHRSLPTGLDPKLPMLQSITQPENRLREIVIEPTTTPYSPIQIPASNVTNLFRSLLNRNTSGQHSTNVPVSCEDQHTLKLKATQNTFDVAAANKTVSPQLPEQRPPSPNCHCSCHFKHPINTTEPSVQPIIHPSLPIAEPTFRVVEPEHPNRVTPQLHIPSEVNRRSQSSPTQLHHQRHAINMQRLGEQLSRLNRIQSNFPNSREVSHHSSPEVNDSPCSKVYSPKANATSVASNQPRTSAVVEAPECRPNASSDRNNQCVWMPVPVEMLTSWFNLLNTMVQHQDTSSHGATGNMVPLNSNRSTFVTDQLVKTERSEEPVH